MESLLTMGHYLASTLVEWRRRQKEGKKFDEGKGRHVMLKGRPTRSKDSNPEDCFRPFSIEIVENNVIQIEIWWLIPTLMTLLFQPSKMKLILLVLQIIKQSKPRWKRIPEYLAKNIDFVACCWALIKTEGQITWVFKLPFRKFSICIDHCMDLCHRWMII